MQQLCQRRHKEAQQQAREEFTCLIRNQNAKHILIVLNIKCYIKKIWERKVFTSVNQTNNCKYN